MKRAQEREIRATWPSPSPVRIGELRPLVRGGEQVQDHWYAASGRFRTAQLKQGGLAVGLGEQSLWREPLETGR